VTGPLFLILERGLPPTLEHARRGSLYQLASSPKTGASILLTRSQQETERFTRAVSSLASARLEERVGAIFARPRVAEEDASERRAIRRDLGSLAAAAE
jgi:hypothetical protein